MSNKYSRDTLLKAFNSARNNKEQIIAGEICGCFSCKNIFYTYEINKWIFNEIGNTALCPYCYIEAVIGEKAGLPITKDFLTAMNEYWFRGKFDIGGEWWFYKNW